MLIDALNTGTARFARILSNFFIVAIVSRSLDTVELKNYFIQASIHIPLAFILPAGIGIASIKLLSGNKYNPSDIIRGGATFLLASLAALYIAATFINGKLFEEQSQVTLSLCFAVGFSSAILFYLGDILRGIHLPLKAAFYCNTLPAIIALLFTIAIYLNATKVAQSSEWFTSAMLAANVIATIPIFILLKKNIRNEDPNQKISSLKLSFNLFRSATPGFSLSLVPSILPALAIFAATKGTNTEGAADIGIAQRIAFLSVVPLWIFSTLAPPRIAIHITDKISNEGANTLRLISGVVLYSTIASSIILAIATPMLASILSADKTTTTPVLIWIAIAFSIPYATLAITQPAAAMLQKNSILYLTLPLSILTFYTTKNLLGDDPISITISHQISLILYATICFSFSSSRAHARISPKLNPNILAKYLRKKT